MRHLTSLVVAAGLLLAGSHIPWARTIRVPGDSLTIQAGINGAGDGDTVLVADGTFTGPGNRDLDFGGRRLVLRSEHGAGGTAIDCLRGGRGFSFHSGEDSLAQVDGFTIRNGLAPGYGGGILCDGSSPAIRRCLFIHNQAQNGGAIGCIGNSSPLLAGTTISGNAASSGGALASTASSPRVTGSILWGNSPNEIAGSSVEVAYSDVRGRWAGVGNIACDPMFADTLSGAYDLLASSPCIESGEPGAPVPSNGGDRADMGAFEYPIFQNGVYLSFSGFPSEARQGQMLSWQATVTNPTPNPLTQDYWLKYSGPAGCDLLRSYQGLTLPPRATVRRALSFPIPWNAPVGRYNVEGLVGSLDQTVLDAESFVLSVTAAHRLAYVESSSGLEDPRMESGRTEVEMGDVNADGHLDLLYIGDHGSPYVNTQEHGITVHYGNGRGAWAVYQNGGFGYGGIALGDVNNDGRMDVGYGMHHNYSSTDFGDQLLEVALGDGTGRNWVPWDDGLATNGETWGMFCTDFADVNNDGYLDLGGNSFGSGAGVHVYISQGNGSWLQSFGFLGGNSTDDFVFGDVNADGNPDFAVAHAYGTVYLGDGQGGFTLADGNLPPPGTMGRLGPDLGDVDNDGYQDLSFARGGGVQVWTYEGPDTWADLSAGLPTAGPYEVTQLCDMDVDGSLDLVAFGHGQITVWLGDGHGGWSKAVDFETYNPGYYAAFRVGGDADHNGYPDIAVIEEEGPWLDAYNHFRFYKEASVPVSLSVIPTYPRGGEILRSGSIRFVEWVSAVPGTESAVVDLEVSTTGPEGPWTAVATDLPNNGRYQWRVLTSAFSQDCYLRYTATAGSSTAQAITPAPFGIVATGHPVRR